MDSSSPDRPKRKRQHRRDGSPPSTRRPSSRKTAKKQTQTEFAIDADVAKSSATFQEAIAILSRAISDSPGGVASIEDPRPLLLDLCRRVTDAALKPNESAECKALQLKVSQYEREIATLSARCHEMSERLELAMGKKAGPCVTKITITQRLNSISAMLTEQINQQLPVKPPKAKSTLLKAQAAASLLSPSFQSELRGERDWNETEVAPALFDSPVKDKKAGKKRVALDEKPDPLVKRPRSVRAHPT
jgi:hypothetical protein